MKNKKKTIIITASILVVAIIIVACILIFAPDKPIMLTDQERLSLVCINYLGIDKVNFIDMKYYKDGDYDYIIVHWHNKVNEIEMYQVFDNRNPDHIFQNDSSVDPDGNSTSGTAKYAYKTFWNSPDAITLNMQNCLEVYRRNMKP